jgi:plasmid stabilization system protein ParE
VKRVQWEPEARADLIHITEHFADKDPRVAELLLDRIEQSAAALARLDTGHPGRMPKLREKSVARTKYILAYRSLARRIVILRVIHSSQDWTSESWPRTTEPNRCNKTSSCASRATCERFGKKGSDARAGERELVGEK